MNTKKFFICCIAACFFISPFANAQRDTMSDHRLGMMYLQKSKNQKTTGFVLLFVGAGMWIGGSIAATNSDSYYSGETGGADFVALAGFICTIVSVPVLINAAKNKGRAEILLRNENIMLGYKQRSIQSIPSVGIGIPIGRR
jgi:hypothetical protein